MLCLLTNTLLEITILGNSSFLIHRNEHKTARYAVLVSMQEMCCNNTKQHKN